MHTELEIAVSGCGLVGGHFLNVFVTKRCGDSTYNCQICVQHIKLDRKTIERGHFRGFCHRFLQQARFPTRHCIICYSLISAYEHPLFPQTDRFQRFLTAKNGFSASNYMQNSWSDFSSRDSSSLNSSGVCIRNSRLPCQGADL